VLGSVTSHAKTNRARSTWSRRYARAHVAIRRDKLSTVRIACSGARVPDDGSTTKLPRFLVRPGGRLTQKVLGLQAKAVGQTKREGEIDVCGVALLLCTKSRRLAYWTLTTALSASAGCINLESAINGHVTLTHGLDYSHCSLIAAPSSKTRQGPASSRD
jgi:hypothetical protein